jgi:hypothetical protein
MTWSHYSRKYCKRYSCRPEDFERRFFFQCLHLTAWPFYLFVGGRQGAYFDCDRRLITRLAHAISLAQVRDELGDFFAEPENRRWLRKVLRVRLSTSKVLKVSKKLLPPRFSRASTSGGGGLPSD